MLKGSVRAGIKDPSISKAYDDWWNSLARQGDPIHRPRLIWESFVAGWNAARDHTKEQTDVIVTAVERMRRQYGI